MTTVQVRFAHPWTDPDTGTSYTPNQVAAIDSDVAAALVYAGACRYVTSGSTAPTTGGYVDMALLRQTLAGYEIAISRDTIAAGRYVRVADDGKTLAFVAPPFTAVGTGGTDGSVVPAADTFTRGTIRLAGDLGGTADSPTVPGLADRIKTIDLADQLATLLVPGEGVSIAAENGRLRISVSGVITGGGTSDGTYPAVYGATY